MIQQTDKKVILYIGGFQLPDKNAAAFRVISNAKVLRKCGYQVVFANALMKEDVGNPHWTEYEGFECYEYQRETQRQYLLSCKKVIDLANECNADIIIAYNYPAIALNSLRKYCKKQKVKCIADATEWYVPTGNIIFRLIKGMDTEFRMRYVQPRLDGVIAISEYLYQYYKDKVKTIKVPPLVDLEEDKWKIEVDSKDEGIKFIYAGSPSSQKERLDFIVKTIEKINSPMKIHLDVLGVTEEQYNLMYRCKYVGNRVSFLGRVSNKQVIKMTKEADWTIILRENNKVVKAGFPTKVVESISCGTPVIANKFSNIEDFLNENNSILIGNLDEIKERLEEIQVIKGNKLNREIFDYNNYIEMFKEIF